MSSQRYLVDTYNITYKEANEAVKEAKETLGKNASEEAILIAANQKFDKSAAAGGSATIVNVPKAPLNAKNGLNVLAFLMNVLFRIDLGPGYPRWLEAASEFGMFETILTPERQWFVIFDMIIFLQGLFAFVQLLPKYRATTLVQDGVGYWFISATGLQLLGSIFFSFDNFVGFCLSTVCVAGMMYCFKRILNTQETEDVSTHSPEDYWLLRFPWSVQAGWFICIFVLSINNFFITLGAGEVVQLLLSFLSFAALGSIIVKLLLFSGDTPNYVIPATIALFLFGTASSFEEPGIEDNFGGWALVLLMATASLLSIGSAVGVAYVLYRNEFSTEQTIEGDEPNGTDDPGYEGGKMDAEKSSIEMKAEVV
jgi:hypothetical protein